MAEAALTAGTLVGRPCGALAHARPQQDARADEQKRHQKQDHVGGQGHVDARERVGDPPVADEHCGEDQRKETEGSPAQLHQRTTHESSKAAGTIQYVLT